MEKDATIKANILSLLLSRNETNWQVALTKLQGLDKEAQKGWIQWQRINDARLFFLICYGAKFNFNEIYQLNFSDNPLTIELLPTLLSIYSLRIKSYPFFRIFLENTNIENTICRTLRFFNTTSSVKKLGFANYMYNYTTFPIKKNDYLTNFGKELNLSNDIVEVLSYMHFRSSQYKDGKRLILLNLSNLNITTLPKSLQDFPKIKKIDLANNQIKELYTTKSLEKVNDLNLKNNQLTTLPKGIEEWKYLKKLNISQNNVQEIPSEVNELTNLQELIWQENNLVALPANIKHLQNLKILRLEHNQLTQLEAISELTNLEQLYLANNQLKDLPKEIARLKHLTHIDVRNNPLSLEALQLLTDSFPNIKVLV